MHNLTERNWNQNKEELGLHNKKSKTFPFSKSLLYTCNCDGTIKPLKRLLCCLQWSGHWTLHQPGSLDNGAICLLTAVNCPVGPGGEMLWNAVQCGWFHCSSGDGRVSGQYARRCAEFSQPHFPARGTQPARARRWLIKIFPAVPPAQQPELVHNTDFARLSSLPLDPTYRHRRQTGLHYCAASRSSMEVCLATRALRLELQTIWALGWQGLDILTCPGRSLCHKANKFSVSASRLPDWSTGEYLLISPEIPSITTVELVRCFSPKRQLTFSNQRKEKTIMKRESDPNLILKHIKVRY